MMELEKMDEDLRQIHEASMAILEQTGMMFHHSGVLRIMEQNGIRIEEQTAFFTREQLMEWVGKAPAQFTMYARNPKYDMEVGGDNVELCPGYGAPFVCEINGKKRAAILNDYVSFLKLFQVSNYHNVNGGVVFGKNQYHYSQCGYYGKL